MTARIRHRRWPQIVTLLSVAVLFVGGWWLEDRFLAPPGWQRPLGQIATGEYAIERVIDGDTIVLRQDGLRVRLQGVDTPETVKSNHATERWGPEATAYTTRFLEEANWNVNLVVDGEPVDRYGRHLAFVWHEGRLLNEELVKQGLARAKTTFDFSQALKDRLLRAQFEAQEARSGIWGASQLTESEK